MIQSHFSSSAEYGLYAQEMFKGKFPNVAEQKLMGEVKINGTSYKIGFPITAVSREALPSGSQQVESRTVTAEFQCIEGDDTTIKERTAHEVASVLAALSVKSRHRDRTVPAIPTASTASTAILFSQPSSPPPLQPTAPPFSPTQAPTLARGVNTLDSQEATEGAEKVDHSAITMPASFASTTAFRQYVDRIFQSQPPAQAMQMTSGSTTIDDREYQLNWLDGTPNVTSTNFSSGANMADFMRQDNSIHSIQEILRIASEARVTPMALT